MSLPLAMTSLSRRIDEVRVAEIADYSTYYQPVVNSQIFGFGQPMDERPVLLNPGVPSMAWGSVVRQIAAGLDVVLDEPLIERIEEVAADRDLKPSPDDPGGDPRRAALRGRRTGRRRGSHRA